ncbi:MAG: type IX secretion system membrane protein PorP/SprF [Sphingobacteriales bacterium]|nr:MAG: type IX secretion system membrane protein PorP/SprF [Sphingobacteriales bacterium]
MKRYIIALVIVTMVSAVVNGQSYHFSQFFTTPLLTNPANTGLTDGPYRLSSNFRAQAVSGGSPYLTTYVSGDMNVFREKIAEGHKAGMGLYLMNDQALNGALNTNVIGLSIGYNVGLDANGVYTLGVGFQGAYHQRELDFNKLSFGSQFERNGYNPSLPVGETFEYYKRNYFDVNTGLLFRAQGEDLQYFAGVSGYNIIRHKDNVFADEYKMPARYVFQGGSSFHAGTQGTVYMSLTYMQQAKAKETTFGAAYGIQLGEEDRNEVTFGVWYRLKDALIPYVGYHIKGFQFGLTYDYTTSAKKAGSQVKNGYELSLTFTAPDRDQLKRALPWY